MLRTAALKIIRALGIEGGCNVQFALDPTARAQLLRHRGQPARQPLLGAGLEGDRLPDRPRRGQDRHRQAPGRDPERRHPQTTAAFEPALDYCVVKIPRWPFDKFAHGDRALGTQMKATGEVMAIDRSLRGGAAEGGPLAGVRRPRLLWEEPAWSDPAAWTIWPLIETPNDVRLWALMAALRRGVDARRDLADARHRPAGSSTSCSDSSRWSGACSREPLTPRPAAATPSASASPTRRSRRCADRAAGAGPRPRQELGHPARLQDGRHLRRRVRGGDAVLLRHLRAGERGAAARRAPKARRDRLRPDPHRPGHRVRLLLGARGCGAAASRRARAS